MEKNHSLSASASEGEASLQIHDNGPRNNRLK